METTTLNTLMTLTFFAPMAIMVAMDVLTARTAGPSIAALPARRLTVTPRPTNRARFPAANEQRYLEAA